jgi:3-deoxy-D-manno-octulosonic-acid transferase
MLKAFELIFVQNSNSQNLLSTIGINSRVAPDTRFDRVIAILAENYSNDMLEKFRGDSKIFIAGSTWPEDEDAIVQLIKWNWLKGFKFILAPHVIDEVHLSKLQARFQNCFRLSQLTSETAVSAQVLIVDNVGQLARLYSYGNIAYVGGGFNAGVHNILEPAVFGLPVLFGPNFYKSAEALDLINLGVAFPIDGYEKLLTELVHLRPGGLNSAWPSVIPKMYVLEHHGGTYKIYEALSTYVPPEHA